MFNATFSNISAISWRPVLVVEEAGDNHLRVLRLAHGRWFSPSSSTTETGRHDIAEILLNVALNNKSNQIKIIEPPGGPPVYCYI